MQAALRPQFAIPGVVRRRALFPPQLLARLDKNGPRYTSYPTADRYHGGFGEPAYRQALRQRRASSPSEPLSLYVHIPFCDSVCYYCACNKVVTRHHDRAARYLDALAREIALHVEELGAGVPVSQLHFGGGTPTFLSDEELTGLMGDLRRAFRFEPDAEISIEVDPRTATPERLGLLRTLGFNRLSFGVQDFDPRVQVAVHRVQSFEEVRALVQSARALGYASVNVDLIYGLPLQTTESFACTISQVIALRPDRIALYAYAHLPERFKPQRRINEADLPDRATPRGPAERGHRGVPQAWLCLHRHGPFRAAFRFAGAGQAARRAAPQFPGLQHAAGPRPGGAGRVGHRPHRQYLQPERQDAGRILRGHRVRRFATERAWS